MGMLAVYKSGGGGKKPPPPSSKRKVARKPKKLEPVSPGMAAARGVPIEKARMMRKNGAKMC